jgi:hypothetical protein
MSDIEGLGGEELERDAGWSEKGGACLFVTAPVFAIRALIVDMFDLPISHYQKILDLNLSPFTSQIFCHPLPSARPKKLFS